jgi:glycosyltransferase involved in cell wall biosynthesis
LKRLLYIHDKENWAIHNVGKLWLEGLEKYIKIDFMKKPSKEVLNDYDMVWFGFHTLWLSYKDFWNRSKSIISIHDPCELSGVSKSTLEGTMVVTASQQMNNFLREKNVDVGIIIPTTGFLDTKDKNEIINNEKIRLLTISSSQGRKNISAVNKLFNQCEELGIDTYAKIGLNDFLSTEDYNKLFDNYNIYICMSKQEGGPIPAIEAMQRGCVVLSTNVGQMPELINNNGFILKENEFLDKIKWIKDNPEWFNNARRKSIDIINEYRRPYDIKKIVKKFLEEKGIL